MTSNMKQSGNTKPGDEVIANVLAAAALVFAGVGILATIGWLLDGIDSQPSHKRHPGESLFGDLDEDALMRIILKEDLK